MAAPIPDKIQLPLEERRGKWKRVLGVHKFSSEEHHERRIAASRRYRTMHPDRSREIQREYDRKMRERLAALKSGPCLDCDG